MPDASDNNIPMRFRLPEILVSCMVLLLCAPLMLLIAVIIRLDSKGPVIFRQERAGLNKRPFSFYKFRTFYQDAKERFPEMYDYRYDRDQLKQLKFKVCDDPRITSVGRWLRRTSLDELPNFWNVLIGDMALVGPRPELIELAAYYEGDMLIMFTVRPGVTGMAQVCGRGDLGFIDTVRHDVEYVRNRSLRLDLKIIWLTLIQCLKMEGSY